MSLIGDDPCKCHRVKIKSKGLFRTNSVEIKLGAPVLAIQIGTNRVSRVFVSDHHADVSVMSLGCVYLACVCVCIAGRENKQKMEERNCTKLIEEKVKNKKPGRRMGVKKQTKKNQKSNNGRGRLIRDQPIQLSSNIMSDDCFLRNREQQFTVISHILKRKFNWTG